MAWKPFNFFEYDPEKVDYQTTKFNIKQALNNNWAHVKDLLVEMRTAIDDRVQKETGKGLSANDFSNNYKIKVDNAQEKPESAEITLAATNWNQTTKTYDFDASYPNASYDIVIELNGGKASEEQTEAWDSANIKGNYPKNTLYAKGDVPTIDIPVIRTVIKKMSSSVRGAGGGGSAKELVNAEGEHIAELEKVEGGSVTVPGGLGNATADNVLKGTNFTSENGLRQDGNIPLKDATTITPSTTEQVIESGQYLNGALTVAGDGNLTAENIREGISIFNTLGVMKEGKVGVDFGVVNISGNQTQVVVEHNLGVVPKRAVLMPISVYGYDTILQSVAYSKIYTTGSDRTMIDVYDHSGINTSNLPGTLSGLEAKTVTFKGGGSPARRFNGNFLWAVFNQ